MESNDTYEARNFHSVFKEDNSVSSKSNSKESAEHNQDADANAPKQDPLDFLHES